MLRSKGREILLMNNKKFHPVTYTYEKFATQLMFNFRPCKLADYQEEELANNNNPFAIAVLANQYPNKTKIDKNYDQRLQFKRQLAHQALKCLKGIIRGKNCKN